MVLTVLFVALVFASPLDAAEVLRWGGDAEGGAPFVEADPADPSVVRGFDVEVAEAIARGLGREPRFIQVAFSAIDQSVERGDFDIGLSGVELTRARAARHAVTLPYFEFREVLTVRERDRDRFRTLEDLRRRRVATLGGTIAWDLLRSRAADLDLQPVSYDDDVHPYEDLATGRVDAVLLDHIIAQRAMGRSAGLVTQPVAAATGYYVAVLARKNTSLRDDADEVLKALMADGTLEAIYRRWGIWDEGQQKLFDRIIAGDIPEPFAIEAAMAGSSSAGVSRLDLVARYLPSLLIAAGVTIVLSILAMALAMASGVIIATGRIYGPPVVARLLGAWVEVIRGTPLLLQLFVIYYGLAEVIRLPAFLAALIGLGLNYGAFESEIYRGALRAVPRGQLEAARTLGLREGQVFRLVRAPQAVRLALAPMTNDFVALLKDSSLVSVITV
ncbi:MAG TPA: ABC transporter substrate-binding protein/permease, partial [Thermoanaerobaculia bacterium]|nr:ABC transporter substrate-binding protein/permease [Thermoanaerobaculia bacterium]